MNISTNTSYNFSNRVTYNPQTFAQNDPARGPAGDKTDPQKISQPQKTDNHTPSNPAETGEQPGSKTAINGQALTREGLQAVAELKAIDRDVRQHEMAHVAAGGRYITSGANFSYQRGPDGKRYAVAGEVGIDTSPVPGDPRATIQKMRQIKAAALAPAHPSSQDLKVASNATSSLSKALSELMILQAEEQADGNENMTYGGLKKASDSYEKVAALPENDLSSFQIAV